MIDLFVVFIIVLTIVLCVSYYYSVKSRWNKTVYLKDVWLGEVPEINRLSNYGVFMLSKKVNQLSYYSELINCCKKKGRYIFFHCVDSGKESMFYNQILVTETLNYADNIAPGDYVVILINENCYLRKVYRVNLEDNTLFYKSSDGELHDVLLSRVMSRAEFMFSKNLLEKVL